MLKTVTFLVYAIVALAGFALIMDGPNKPDLDDMQAGTVKLYRVVPNTPGAPVQSLCSGSLVGDDKVVTAGHCLRTPHLFTYIMEDENGERRILEIVERETPLPQDRANPEETSPMAQDDWAVMEIKGEYTPEYTFTMACGYEVELWDEAFAFGFPGNQGFSFTATQGYIYNVSQDLDYHINTATGYGGGMSGGPLTDVNGNIIGINALMLRSGGALFNKATSISRVCEVL